MKQSIRIANLPEMEGYKEYDFVIYSDDEKKQKRIRRKIEISQSMSDKLEELLSYVLENTLDRNSTINYIRQEQIFSSYETDLISYLDSLYFNYLKSTTWIDPTDKIENEMNALFPIDLDARFCFLGKAGVGKSTIIQKLSPFFGIDGINFPFTDTSRTSTFPAEYCFVPNKRIYRFAVIFKEKSIIDLQINECIERGINKLIELKLNNETTTSPIDIVIPYFFTDPSQTYDIRYSLGKYVKTTSPNYSLESNQGIINFWNNIFDLMNKLIDTIIPLSETSDIKPDFYQERFQTIIKESDSANQCFSLYLELGNQIHNKIEDNINRIFDNLANNNAIDITKRNNEQFLCEFKHSSILENDFFNFIKIFTEKKASNFGRALFNLVGILRIELPLNPKVNLSHKDKSFSILDTIGIAHNNDGSGGFEDSTRLSLSEIDGVAIIDDSNFNGDNNVGAILQHLSSRIDYNKIFFTFTFFDNLKKADFDEDDDIDSQKITYLSSIETQTIKNVIIDREVAQTLCQKLTNGDTFFLKGLMNQDDYSSVSNMLDQMISSTVASKNIYGFFKYNKTLPIFEYDYKKLPLLYSESINSFKKTQYEIYSVHPPHFKTTEALTRRLATKISYFSGARTLKPVDDLYNSLITVLAPYISKPQKINIGSKDNDPTPPSIDTIIGILKNVVSEKLRSAINCCFFEPSKLQEWKELYQLSGLGTDLERRNGILDTEELIAPDIIKYLNDEIPDHLINIIEDSLKTSLIELEQTLDLD